MSYVICPVSVNLPTSTLELYWMGGVYGTRARAHLAVWAVMASTALLVMHVQVGWGGLGALGAAGGISGGRAVGPCTRAQLLHSV